MSDHPDDPQDWPLRDWSSRLRPPSRPDGQSGDEPVPAEPEESFEPSYEPVQPGSGSEPEILYDEDEFGAGLPEVADEQPGVAAVSPAIEEAEQVEGTEHAEGEFRVPDGYPVLEGAPNGSRRAVAVVVSRFNGEITNGLLASALAELEEAGVSRDAVLVMPVPGAFELPIAAMALAKTRRYACVIALGCVIRGETPHFDFVASEAASGLQLAGIETGVPVAFGLLTTDTAEQAEARLDKGATAARTALEMADVFSLLRTAAARQ